MLSPPSPEANMPPPIQAMTASVTGPCTSASVGSMFKQDASASSHPTATEDIDMQDSSPTRTGALNSNVPGDIPQGLAPSRCSNVSQDIVMKDSSSARTCAPNSINVPSDTQGKDFQQCSNIDSAPWTRPTASTSTRVNQTDRVSRPRSLLVLRPLNKFNINHIPKQTLAHLIGSTAPQPFLAELATHRYDTLGNCLHITVYDESHAQRLLLVSQLQILKNGSSIAVPVEIKVSPYRPNTSRGVIEVEPEDNNEEIFRWLRCEQAKILACHRLGRSNRAVLTFDSPTPPKVVKYYMAIVKVTPYQPRRMVCYNCHSIGHMAKYCPSPTVCSKCGKLHPDTDDCGPTIYCVVCDELGHIALNPTCPGRIPKPPSSSPTKDRAQGISWADRVQQLPKDVSFPRLPSQLPPQYESEPKGPFTPKEPDNNLALILAELKALRAENQQLKAEIIELKRNQNRKNPTPGQYHEKATPQSVLRRTRSPSIKKTPTSQARIDPQLNQVLQNIRTDIHQERLSRQEDTKNTHAYIDAQLNELRELLKQVVNHLSSSQSTKEPPRKIPPPRPPTEP